jgi:hypothetical protein
MFWIITGAVLAVVLLGAWIHDRRSGSLALTDRDRGAFTRHTHDQAHADASTTQLGQWNGPL